MHFILVLALLAVFSANAAATEPAALQAWTHARPISVGAGRLLAAAIDRAPSVTSLLADLERTDVVVYIEESYPADDRPPAYLTFLSSAAGTRYLRVRVERGWRASLWDRIAQLAHELRHALEVAAAPEVQDDASLGRLYQRIGWEGAKGRYETDAARLITIKVRNEVAAPNPANRPSNHPPARVLPFD